MLELLVANLAAYAGISTAWATVIVTAINAGATVVALVSIFASAGISAGLIVAIRTATMKMTTKAAVAW